MIPFDTTTISETSGIIPRLPFGVVFCLSSSDPNLVAWLHSMRSSEYPVITMEPEMKQALPLRKSFVTTYVI